MSKKWDSENMKTIAVNLKKDEAEAFRQLALDRGSTPAALLRGFIRGSLNESTETGAPAPSTPWGVDHIVSYKNTDRLKREVAFHNPDNLSPDKMLNAILDRYFKFVEEVRN